MPRQRTSNVPPIQEPDGYKQCRMCGALKPHSAFSKNKNRPDGRCDQCKLCKAVRQRSDTKRIAYMRAYRKANRARINAAMDSYKKRNWGKVKARKLLNQAVYRGKMSRPDTCSRCGAVAKVEGHHHDYSKPYDVTWFCGPCHEEVERIFKEYGYVQR